MGFLRKLRGGDDEPEQQTCPRCRMPAPAEAEECPECGWVGLERKVSKAEGEVRTCMKCQHKIVVAQPEEMALT
jgi:ssDNA-binding Zn-finger/Zn-ribbon topoisomerase 1